MKKRYGEIYVIDSVKDIVDAFTEIGEKYQDYRVVILRKNHGLFSIWNRVLDYVLDLRTIKNLKGKKRLVLTNQILQCIEVDDTTESVNEIPEVSNDVKPLTAKDVADYIAHEYNDGDVEDIGVLAYLYDNTIVYDCIIDRIGVDEATKMVVVITL